MYGFYPDVKCVALSSYDDFNYVKESLTSGAMDYILKHMLTRESIENIIKNMLTNIRERISDMMKFRRCIYPGMIFF